MRTKDDENVQLKNDLAEAHESIRNLENRISGLKAESEWLQAHQRQEASPAPAQSAQDVDASYSVPEVDHSGCSAEIDLLKIGKESAERDRDFLREQYQNASSYVSEVQAELADLKAENNGLQASLAIAEKQVTNGVQLIRANFECRNRLLTEELKEAHATIRILTEKDRRTDDEVRRQAAMNPELLASNGQLRATNAELRGDISELLKTRDVLLVQDKDKIAEIEKLQEFVQQIQKENLRLKTQVARMAAKERFAIKEFSSVNPNDADASVKMEDLDPEGDVYLCRWAISAHGDRCGAILQSIQVFFSLTTFLQCISSSLRDCKIICF